MLEEWYFVASRSYNCKENNRIIQEVLVTGTPPAQYSLSSAECTASFSPHIHSQAGCGLTWGWALGPQSSLNFHGVILAKKYFHWNYTDGSFFSI